MVFFYDSCGLKKYRSLQISGNVATFIYRMNHRSLEEHTVRYCTPIAWLYMNQSTYYISIARYLTWGICGKIMKYTQVYFWFASTTFLNTKLAANSRCCFFCFCFFFSKISKPVTVISGPTPQATWICNGTHYRWYKISFSFIQENLRF